MNKLYKSTLGTKVHYSKIQSQMSRTTICTHWFKVSLHQLLSNRIHQLYCTYKVKNSQKLENNPIWNEFNRLESVDSNAALRYFSLKLHNWPYHSRECTAKAFGQPSTYLWCSLIDTRSSKRAWVMWDSNISPLIE